MSSHAASSISFFAALLVASAGPARECPKLVPPRLLGRVNEAARGSRLAVLPGWPRHIFSQQCRQAVARHSAALLVLAATWLPLIRLDCRVQALP